MLDAWTIYIEQVERWELMMLTAYEDKGKAPQWVIDEYGDEINWAIGLGHTNINKLPPFVTRNTVLKNREEGFAIFKNDIETVYMPQLDALFKKIDFTPPTLHYKLGFLDTLYGRGAGRLAGDEAGSVLKGSYAWHILEHEKGTKNWMVRAANALSHSHVEDFTPLDVDSDGNLRDGLVSRRAFNTALSMWVKF